LVTIQPLLRRSAAIITSFLFLFLDPDIERRRRPGLGSPRWSRRRQPHHHQRMERRSMPDSGP
jgi:hypothetical protein